MKMRKSLRMVAVAGCVAVLLSLLTVSSAAAGYKTGKYEGTTSQGEAISFKAKKLGVKRFSFAVILDCDDGTAVQLTNSGAQAPTDDHGRFEAQFLGEGTTVLNGKLKRKRANGTFESEATSDTGAQCSGSGDWTAKKQ